MFYRRSSGLCSLLFSQLLSLSFFSRKENIPAGLTAEQIDNHLIGAHHDGSVRDLSDEMGGEATVQCPVTFLSGYCQQCLEKRVISAAFFS